jgi:hypothetical protein
MISSIVFMAISLKFGHSAWIGVELDADLSIMTDD